MLFQSFGADFSKLSARDATSKEINRWHWDARIRQEWVSAGGNGVVPAPVYPWEVGRSYLAQSCPSTLQSAKIHLLPASPFLNEHRIINLTKNNYLAINWVLAYELEFNI